MAAKTFCSWNLTDVPEVQPSDLLAALSLWLVRERQGCMLVTGQGIATIDAIETAVIEMHGSDPSRGLSVLLRLRCLVAALSSRRFRSLAHGLDRAALPRLVAAAAALRLNAGRGFSPVRLSWAMTAAVDSEQALAA